MSDHHSTWTPGRVLTVACLLCLASGMVAASSVAAQVEPAPTPPAELGELEQGLQLLLRGDFDQARKAFKQAKTQEFRGMRPLLIRLSEFYHVSAVALRSRNHNFQGYGGEDAKKVTAADTYEKGQKVWKQAEKRPPKREEFEELLTWARQKLVSDDPESPIFARMLLCHLRLLNGELEIPATAQARDDDDEVTADLAEDSIQGPERIFDPRPPYPVEERRAQIGGIIITQGTIDLEGCLTGSEILKGVSRGMNDSVLDTLDWWAFQPARRNGEPTAVMHRVTLSFALSE